MKIMRFRPLRAGVCVSDYWRAVRAGQRESALGPPAPMPLAVYDALRDLERAFGRLREKHDDPAEVAAVRARIAEFDREWLQAAPLDPPPPAFPRSPLERRQLSPRRKPRPSTRPADVDQARRPVFRPIVAPPPGGVVPVPAVLRRLVATGPGAEWWRLQGLGLGRSPEAQAAYAAALRQVHAGNAGDSAEHLGSQAEAQLVHKDAGTAPEIFEE